MDYIQEELRRQREALAGLLLGGAPRRDRDGGGNDGVPAASLKVPGGRSGAGTAGTVPAPEEEQPGYPAAGAVPAAESGEAMASGGPGGVRPRAEGPGGTAEGLPRGAAPAPLADGWRRNGYFIFPEEAAWPALGRCGTAAEIPGSPAARRGPEDAPRERTVTEYVYPAGGGSAGEAESLSRAIQRDARRYDGGFSLY